MWVAVHVLQLPPLIIGRWNAVQGGNKCEVLDRSHLQAYMPVQETLCFTMPEFVIVAMYAVIVYQMCQLQQKKRSRVAAELVPPGGDPRPRPAVPAPNFVAPKVAIVAAPNRNADPQGTRGPPSQGGRHQKTRLLTVLVLEMILCWTPNVVFFILVANVANYWDPTLFLIQSVGQIAHSWLSPLIFYLCLDGLRTKINRMLRCNFS
ncbi:hypothetical protein BV898_03017 [Hypsibius exemplaris]|uniref:G-protein coupled receptors family 1 profile domain-containing protein n=1 Tax=Hypsibius exemplaris TaxID=2072580 RepID=A0A1W0X5Y3_HYPEX|nr:hypothetical protein BV898_03017 [Hypsibius exemplaris]